MPEYIEREELIKKIELSIKSWGRDCNSNATAMVGAYQDMLLRVKNIPAIDIVRCKDCEYHEERKCLHGVVKYGCKLAFYPFALKADDYCSHGKRKEHNNECK